MNNLTLSVNLSNLAFTQYCNFNFNSFCKIGSKNYSANDAGIFELTGNTDAGANIDSFFELVLSDFGIANMKRVRSIYVGGESEGQLTLTLKDDEDNSRPYSFSLASDSKQISGKIDIGRDGQGRYWQTRIDNTSGCYFAIDLIELSITVLGRKPR